MSKQSSQLPSPMELPPVPGEGPTSERQEQPVIQQGSERNPEFVPTTPRSAPQSNQPQADNSHTTVDPTNSPVPIPVPPTASHAAQSSNNSPAIADDVDLIEKEWVEKAKEIVEKTRENPYLQNKALNEIKADYIKKRYNKELAKSEE